MQFLLTSASQENAMLEALTTGLWISYKLIRQRSKSHFSLTHTLPINYRLWIRHRGEVAEVYLNKSLIEIIPLAILRDYMTPSTTKQENKQTKLSLWRFNRGNPNMLQIDLRFHCYTKIALKMNKQWMYLSCSLSFLQFFLHSYARVSRY